jgi:(S)-ureidoglycine aminohydrolase
MTSRSYYAAMGGHPPQTDLLTGRAVFTEAYAVIPKGVMRDIVTSLLPFWDKTRAWVIARPLSGFAETFSQYIMEVRRAAAATSRSPTGSRRRDLRRGRQHDADARRHSHDLQTGGYAFIPPGTKWSAKNGERAAGALPLGAQGL